MSAKPHPRALVIGASMAGLLAARALSEHFEEVWLLERDVLPTGAQHRKGTPHAGHAHGLLARGRMVMESLFPGLTAGLVEQGALEGELGLYGVFIAGGRRFKPASAGATALAVSRLKLEAALRQRVLALPGVRVQSNVDVLDVVFNDAGDRVTGVRMVLRDEQGHAAGEQTLAADLVVDASGRASRSPAWLQAHGYEAPEEERVGEGINVGYATAYFERQVSEDDRLGAVICSVTPQLPIGGVMLAQEPDEQGRTRWCITLGGYGPRQPAPTREAMLEHARPLGSPEMLDVLQHARLIGDVARYQFAYSRRRRFERLTRFPQRYLAIGDALASFNPIYGQGMTVAACEAVALRDCVARGLDGQLHRRFFKAAARIIDTPWQTAVGTDLALDFMPGKRTRATRFINAYVQRVHRAAQRDGAVSRAFVRVAHLVAPPASLFAPHILLRVLWGSWRAGAQRPNALPAAHGLGPVGATGPRAS